MSEPLDDFNRRMTAGNSSWTMGPPTNSAESAAQSMLDTQQRLAGPTGGGSIAFGMRPGAVLLLIGILLFAVGNYAVENLREGKALAGIFVLVLSGGVILVGGGGLAVACIKALGSSHGRRALLFAAVGGSGAWWLLPLVGFFGVTAPRILATAGVVAVVLFFMGGRRHRASCTPA